MAHSTSAAAGEISYLLPGKIVKVIKPDIKNNDGTTTTTSNIYVGNAGAAVNSSGVVVVGGNSGGGNGNIATNMGAYSQVNNPSQLRLARNVNNNVQQIENASYTVIIPQQQKQQQAIGGGSNSGGSDCSNSAVSIKYEPVDEYSGSHSVVVKREDRFSKYIQHSNTKLKSKTHTTNSTNASVQRKRKPEKAGKGLRHFSMKVCEKVKEKGTTTYNEVADELVTEEIQNNSFGTPNCDQKNIRRRVYDALNVLMAMEIISKDKKEIRWIGLPTNSVEQCTELERENEESRERIKQKHQQLRELLLQQVSFKSLIDRNKEAERQGVIPTSNSSIQLPFIIVNTHKSTKIDCSVTNDKSEYIFKFNDQFEMHDDAEVLKRMGLLFGLDKGECSCEDIERAKLLVPPNFEKYIEAYGNGKISDGGDATLNCDSDDEMPMYMELINDSQECTRTDAYDLDDEDADDDEDVEHSDID